MFWKRWGAVLDRLPAKAGLPLGLGLGAAAGALLLLAPSAVGVPAFLVFSVVAGFLAWSGEPVETLPVPTAQVEPIPVPEAPAATALLPAIEMVAIPAGSFLMGSPQEESGRANDEGPVHTVEISDFLCMKTPVTRRLFAEVMGSDPGWPKGPTDDRPACRISWFDAIEFCNRLSKREGLALCYERTEDRVTWHRTAGGYRLPTEAEWEYACRAGTRTRWSFGDDEARLGEHAWFLRNAGGGPRPVGQKKPSLLGLHDMHGNVWEWCWDWYGSYEPAFDHDPTGLPNGTVRVVRGGAFLFKPRELRSASRSKILPGSRNRLIGFRCVRGPRRQPVH